MVTMTHGNAKRFCIWGHDTYVTGRRQYSHTCSQCDRDRRKANPAPRTRLEPIAKRKHEARLPFEPLGEIIRSRGLSFASFGDIGM